MVIAAEPDFVALAFEVAEFLAEILRAHAARSCDLEREDLSASADMCDRIAA